MPYLIFIFLSIGLLFQVSSCYLKKKSNETYQTYIKAAPYDAIIIPGIPYDSGKSHVMLKVRMYWAKQLFEKGITKNIIFSGAAVHSPYIEGHYMKILADSLGIPSNHTFVEPTALHGTENAANGFIMAQQMGFKKIALATDPFQSIFLESYEGVNVKGLAYLPFPVDSMPAFTKDLPAINPAEAFVPDFVPLKSRPKQ
ncbi:MAG: YdcF family protein [Bacteroidota bacterium]